MIISKVEIDYLNWRGVQAKRIVQPVEILWASTEWHPEPQLLMRAIDTQKNKVRYFAMRDIKGWRSL